MLRIIILVVLLSGCTLSPDISDIVKEGTSGVAKIQLANSANTIANTIKTRADTSRAFVNVMGDLITNLPVDKQAELIKQSLEVRATVATRSRYIGLLEGGGIWLFLIVIARVVRYVVGVYKPKEETRTTTYQK